MEFDQSSVKFIKAIVDEKGLKELFLSPIPVVGFIMAGRSNVGKSSLLNTILGREVARVSNTPGRTRDINIFQFSLRPSKSDAVAVPATKFLLIDLPGYGHANVSKQEGARWGALLGELFDILPPTVLVLNMQDVRHPMQESDRLFLKFFKNRPLSAALVFNKYDKLKTQSERARFDKYLPQILKETRIFNQAYIVSAETNYGISELSVGLIDFLLKNTP